jgi:hypothetical protein
MRSGAPLTPADRAGRRSTTHSFAGSDASMLPSSGSARSAPTIATPPGAAGSARCVTVRPPVQVTPIDTYSGPSLVVPQLVELTHEVGVLSDGNDPSRFEPPGERLKVIERRCGIDCRQRNYVLSNISGKTHRASIWHRPRRSSAPMEGLARSALPTAVAMGSADHGREDGGHQPGSTIAPSRPPCVPSSAQVQNRLGSARHESSQRGLYPVHRGEVAEPAGDVADRQAVCRVRPAGVAAQAALVPGAVGLDLYAEAPRTSVSRKRSIPV